MSKHVLDKHMWLWVDERPKYNNLTIGLCGRYSSVPGLATAYSDIISKTRAQYMTWDDIWEIVGELIKRLPAMLDRNIEEVRDMKERGVW